MAHCPYSILLDFMGESIALVTNMILKVWVCSPTDERNFNGYLILVKGAGL